MENIYPKGYIYSACFLLYNNNYYIATSNRIAGSNYADSIKIYDFNGNKIKDIKNSKENAFIIDCYNNNKDVYIIIGSKGYLKSYDFNKNALYFKYQDNNNINNDNNSIFSFQVLKNNEIIKLIGSCDDGFIRIWGFDSGNLVKKIKVTDKKN